MDVTPMVGANSPFFSRTGMLGIYLDWARQRWNKYVVSYSLKMQGDAVVDGLAAARRAWARAGRRAEWASWARRSRSAWAVPAAVLAAAGGLFLMRRRAARRDAAEPRAAECRPLPRAYSRLVRRLSALGHRRSAGAPMSEMVRSAAALRPELRAVSERFLDLYQRDRFGPTPLCDEEAREAGRLAARLRREAPSAR